MRIVYSLHKVISNGGTGWQPLFFLRQSSQPSRYLPASEVIQWLEIHEIDLPDIEPGDVTFIELEGDDEVLFKLRFG